MKETIRCIHRDTTCSTYQNATTFGRDTSNIAMKYHQSFPEYSSTPLADLSHTAHLLGIKNLFVKDESRRFGLNAFKGLGGSFCLGKYLANRLGKDLSEINITYLTNEKIREEIGDITFVTATDGNHGRGIAWAAQMLEQKAVIYMPKGSVRERLENIRKYGAQAEITDLTYDEAVQYAAECEEKYGWVLVQDTAWAGYEEIPQWIMQGYTTMALEAVLQLEALDQKPTHIFLQAGVGAMAGALTGFFTDYYKDEKPILTIVEPNHANCIFKTAEASDGRLHSIEGDLDTIMAGLACGTPCTIGWEMLNLYAENFVSVPDEIAEKGMRILGNPVADDPKVISGESGAVTTGLVAELLQNPELSMIRDQLQLDQDSVVLCFSTEGDTDQDNYRRIVWDGK